MTAKEVIGFSPEEQVELDRSIIESKPEDDPSFDVGFTLATNNWIYAPDFDHGEWMFIEAQRQMNTLYHYYEYSRRFVNKYIRDMKETYEKEDTGEMEYGLMGEELFDDVDSLPDLNNYSILTVLVSIYESFLKNTVVHVKSHYPNLQKNNYMQSQNKSKSKSDRKPKYQIYLDFLIYQFGMKIQFEEGMEDQLKRIRSTRNAFVHGLSEITNNDLNEKDPSVVQNKTRLLTNAFMIDSFECIGNMIYEVETAYYDRLREIELQ